MIERFDHAVIGIPDLESGMATFRRLGFEVSEGGRHPSLGTRNAIVRFGLDYLELLTVEDPATAQARGPFGQELLAFVGRDTGPVGFVLAGTHLDEEVDGLEGLGITAEGPFEMHREHVRGGRLNWRLVVPGGSPWRKPWPYLIDWITDEDQLLAWDPPGNHPCRVTGVAGIDLVVDDLEGARRLYETAFRLRASPREPSWPGSTSLHYRIGSFRLGLHHPVEDGPMAAELRDRGPGCFRITVSSSDLHATASVLRSNAVPYCSSRDGIDVDPAHAAGTRLRILPG